MEDRTRSELRLIRVLFRRPRRIGGGIAGWRQARPSGEAEQAILEARARTNLGPARLAGILRRPRSTIWKVLWRHGVSRRRRSAPRQSYRRNEWAQPGALLHMDTKHLARFERPGHWAHGDRSGHGHDGPGTSYAHCVVDDHSRLAYVELHGADSTAAAAATLRRAIKWFREQGCGPVEAVMTDNDFIYRRSRAFADVLAEHHARDRALTSFLRYYNRRRPHTSLGDRPPISRVHHL